MITWTKNTKSTIIHNDLSLQLASYTTAELLALSLGLGDVAREYYNSDTSSKWLWTGTKWRGETAWVTLTLAADWAGTLRYKRLDNDLVIFSGTLIRITNPYVKDTTIATMPIGFRNVEGAYKYVAGVKENSSISSFTPLLAYSTGILSVYENLSIGDLITFDPMFYSLN